MTQAGHACPKCGQTSSESDFCSECGARIGPDSTADASVGGASTGITASAAPGGSAATIAECPACHTPRPSPDARFCEVCRYDFLNQVAGGAPVLQLDSAQTGSAPATVSVPRPPQPGGTSAPNGVTWDVVIAVDPSLDTDPDTELTAPADPERTIPLDKTENLIGRRDAKQAIVPDVRANDPSVSRRHAKLLVHDDGTVAILDLDSANGTFVNGEQILDGVPRALSSDDVVTIGRWTSLRIQPRSSHR